MAICGVCGRKASSRTIGGIAFCEECFRKLDRIRSGDADLIAYYLTAKAPTCSTPAASQYMHDQAMLQKKKMAAHEEEQRQKEQEAQQRELEAQQRKQEEGQKQAYANSLGEFYEYNVITAVNTVDGRTDAEKMKRIIEEQARKGWRLHTVYSNVLGKNAISLLGIGINSTASEDVMIFERRIRKNP